MHRAYLMKLTGIYGIQDALLAIVALSMQTLHLLCESKRELSLATINHITIKLDYSNVLLYQKTFIGIKIAIINVR